MTPGARAVLALAATMAVCIASPSLTRADQRVPAAATAQILAPPLQTPALGSAQADVTVIEYFDYNCPVCRQTEHALQKLVARDKRVRVVYKDWPIFGAVSAYAAYCTFAAAAIGQYPAAHHALIDSKESLDSEKDVEDALREGGLDVAKLKTLIAAHRSEYSAALTRNNSEASALALRGTPGLIIGNRLISGALDYESLERAVRATQAVRAQ